jgi:hypothetical protein
MAKPRRKINLHELERELFEGTLDTPGIVEADNR